MALLADCIFASCAGAREGEEAHVDLCEAFIIRGRPGHLVRSFARALVFSDRSSR